IVSPSDGAARAHCACGAGNHQCAFRDRGAGRGAGAAIRVCALFCRRCDDAGRLLPHRMERTFPASLFHSGALSDQRGGAGSERGFAMKIGFLAMSGIRAHDPKLLKLGLTLPGFVERSKTIASLPSLGLLYLAACTPQGHELKYFEAESDGNEPAEVYTCD